MNVIVALVVTVVAFMAISNLIQSGQIPPAPLGLEFASRGLPATVVGVPTTYVLGIFLFDLMIVFGNGGGSSGDGDIAADQTGGQRRPLGVGNRFLSVLGLTLGRRRLSLESGYQH